MEAVEAEGGGMGCRAGGDLLINVHLVGGGVGVGVVLLLSRIVPLHPTITECAGTGGLAPQAGGGGRGRGGVGRGVEQFGCGWRGLG